MKSKRKNKNPGDLFDDLFQLFLGGLAQPRQRVLVKAVPQTAHRAVATTAFHITIPPSTHNTWPVM